MGCFIRMFVAAILATFFVSVASAQEILTVQVERDGKVTSSVTFDADQLHAMGLHQIKTENAYVDGMKTFEGPLLRDLVTQFGAEDLSLGYMVAENDYTVEIPMHEFFAYDVILALSVDGEAFSPRGKGPIWVIYPMSSHKKLQDPKYNGRLIWQLTRIVFK